MATVERRRQRRKGRLKRASRGEVPSGPTGVHHIPDHLLELILVRVGSSLALLRAAFACKRWRRIVADTGFLSRFRSLHAAHVAAHYHVVDPRFAQAPPDGNQVVVPDPSPDALDRRHFSLDFLPDGGGSWELADSRGGLLLLYKKRTNWSGKLFFPDLVVCEPLTRRYQGILYREEMKFHLCFGAFLLDGDATVDKTGGCIGMSNFRVVLAVYEDDALEYGRGAPRACVFSSGGDGGWHVVESAASSEILLPSFEFISFVGRARWSLYWTIERDGAVLALDETTAEFSLVTFPEIIGGSYARSTFRVIGGDDGAFRIVVLIDNDLKVFAQLQNSGGEWVVEKLLRLPEATYGLPGRKNKYFQRTAMIVAANARYILVTPQEKTWIFSVELETLEVEREHERNKHAGEAYPYELPWPPALQAAAADRGSRRTRLSCHVSCVKVSTCIYASC